MALLTQIGTSGIKDNAITTAKVAADAVTQPKIGAGAVGTTEIADNAVLTGKIQDGTLTTADLTDSAVNNAKIATGISSSKLTGALPALDGSALTGVGGSVLLLDTAYGGFAGSGSLTEYAISNTYINSTYDAYILEGNIRASDDNKYLYFHVDVGGSKQTGSIYGYESHYLGGTAVNNNNGNTVWSFMQYGSGNAVGEGVHFHMLLANVNNANQPATLTGIHTWHEASGGAHNACICSGALLPANRGDVVNGLRLSFHSGNVYGGDIKIYGLKT
tara:strand:- start:360 stop:1184 length:825 start_codon:yes stop_codon:yes gene_type:complete